jgi:hypothetical protein
MHVFVGAGLALILLGSSTMFFLFRRSARYRGIVREQFGRYEPWVLVSQLVGAATSVVVGVALVIAGMTR